MRRIPAETVKSSTRPPRLIVEAHRTGDGRAYLKPAPSTDRKCALFPNAVRPPDVSDVPDRRRCHVHFTRADPVLNSLICLLSNTEPTSL